MAGKQLSEFRQQTPHTDVFLADNGTLRCTALRLRNGDMCLYSPAAGLSEAALASLQALGRVRYLLAPNHYHHKAIAEFQQAFPDAEICAPNKARPRLAHVTGLSFSDLSSVEDQLPSGMRILRPRGLKTGEVWLRVGKMSAPAWIVVDAIAGPKMTVKNKQFESPTHLKTFPSYGVEDVQVYRNWIDEQLEQDMPQMVIPCHGGVISSPELPAKISVLLTEMLG